MENIKEKFTKAIHDKVKLRITYQADKYKSKITRLCTPMDIKQKEKDSSKAVKYHFWDYEGREVSHTTSKLLKDIYSVEVTSIRFNPSDFVTLDKTNWGISRDWCKFSQQLLKLKSFLTIRCSYPIFRFWVVIRY